MHFRSLGLLVVTQMLLSGCGVDSSGMTTHRDALNNNSNGNQDWVLSETTWPLADGSRFIIPMDCLAEDFEYVGTVRFNDHLETTGHGLKDNWVGWYDPERFTSLTTGQTWVFLPGASNTGSAYFDDSGAVLSWAGRAHIPLQNTTTGQKIQFRLDVHTAVNGSGEVKHDFVYFGCLRGP
jgi:hypothetical protein